MSVRVDADGVIRLEGACPVDDALVLHGLLLASPRSTVDWTSCDTAHTAVVQILLAGKVALRGPPRGDFLRRHIAPALERAAHRRTASNAS